MASLHGEANSSFTASGPEQQDAMIDFTPRSYQLELFEKAKEQNSILVLGTGSGKTFISILLIREYADQIRGQLRNGKRTVFVVNTVPLVHQQAKAIKRHTALTVGAYEGSMGVDFWTDDKWNAELNKNEVLVMVAKIFLDLVLHARLPLSKVNLLIIDECHHATGNHPMREVMREFEALRTSSVDRCPKVLGLTACVIHKKCKKKDVMPTMRNLEAAMNCALVTSTDIAEVVKFSTGPKEKVVCYESESPSEYQEIIKNQLEGIIEDVKELPNIDKKCKKVVKKKLNNISYIMDELGDWCVARAIKYEMDDLEDAEEIEDVPAVKELMNILRSRLDQILTLCLKQEQEMVNPIHYISKKAKKLIEIFHACKKGVNGLVFVDRRNTAKIIYDFLLEAAKINSDLSFLKPLYCVGCNTRPGLDINLAKLEQRKQSETLDKFRKGECNLIISTSVLEEGVDIRKCNIVIRFDKPPNFRSYVQSRGRARALPSRYVLMVMVNELHEFMENVSMYREIEVVLSQLCHDRKLPSESDTSSHFAEDQYLLPFEPFGCDGPKVTMNSAIPLINVYCGQLPHDKFTDLTAEIIFTPNMSHEKQPVRAGIRLPINAPLKEVLFGDIMENKDLAKKSAALCLCRKLYQMRELDQHLRPRDQKEDVVLDGLVEVSDEPVEAGAPIPGTRKRRQLYEKEMCKAFTHDQQGQYLLYSLIIEPQGTNISDIKIDSRKCATSVGLICKKELVHCPFHLYFHKWGEVEIRIKPLGLLANNNSDVLNKIEHFHNLVYQQILQINPSLFEYKSQCSGVLIAPVTRSGTIDVVLLQNLETLTTLRPPMDHFSSQEYHFERSAFEDSIIYPIYNPKDPLFYVTEICDNVNPQSKFPVGSKGYDTYEDYFFLKYNLKITNKHQPILVGKHMIKELNYLKKQDHSKKKKDDSRGSDPPRFVPELCGVIPLRASFWWQLMCVPSILHRLNSFGLAHQLSYAINPVYCQTEALEVAAMDFTWSELYARTSIHNLEDNLAVSLMNEKRRHIHPSMLVHALTLRQANDNFDLERLEILGDSFLKYIIAEYLYLNFQEDHEGRLSLRRVKLVCNKTLYGLAKLKNIPQKILSTNLYPRGNGLLPGFFVKPTVERQLKTLDLPHELWPELPNFGHVDNLEEAIEVRQSEKGKRQGGRCYNPWTEHELADKSVADCVEALLGAYLLVCGSKAAISFLHNLGVGVSGGKGLLTTKLVVHSALISKETWAESEVKKLYQKACLDRLEEKINYKFTDISFIVQAVTHTSFRQTVTDCYQRLEFLGDAVLDYLVTGLVFSRHTQYSPGQVSDLRSHYVKNETLALVCVKAGLQKHLLHMAPKLQATIDKFLNTVDSGIEEDLNIEEDEVEWQDVDVPKALGDLVESIIGAVYLDSGRSLKKAWNVIVALMGGIMEITQADIPINRIRKLYEEMPGKVVFTKILREEEDDLAKYEVKVEGLPVLVGTGKNYRTAKLAAAKVALQKLREAQNR